MRRMVRAAVGQICSTRSMTNNLQQCQRLTKRAAEAGAKALFLPEAADFLATSSDETLSLTKEISQSEFVNGLQQSAKQHNIAINVGLHEPTSPPSSKILNTLIWISAEGQMLPDTRYTKLHMFDIDMSSSGGVTLKESDSTQAGNEVVLPFDSPVGKVGSQICFDVRFPEPGIRLRRLGADVIVYPSAFTVPTGKLGHWEVLLRARAIETECYIVASAQCGRHNEKRVSYGDSLVVDPRGQIVGRLAKVEDPDKEVEGGRKEDLLLFDIDFEKIKQARQSIPLARRIDVYPEI